MIFLISFNISAYTDYAMTDILLPNTVRAEQDLNLTFVVTSNQSSGFVDVEVTIYNPGGDTIYAPTTHNLIIGENNLVLADTGDPLLYSTQPYMIRAIIKDSDDNPTNNHYSKYFTVSKASTRVPVSDLPLFSGIILALLFLFVFSFKENKILKNDKK